MKYHYSKHLVATLIAVFMLLAHTHATVLTVSNNPSIPAQYSSFTEAYNAAADGDTLYMHPSTFNYGAVTIAKPLVIIGPGHRPAEPRFVGTYAYFSTMTFNATGNGSTMIGLRVQNIRVNSSQNVNNLTWRRCRIWGNNELGSYSTLQNWYFEGCVFSGGFVDNGFRSAWQSFYYYNCVFTNGFRFQNNDGYAFTVDHCLFLGSYTSPKEAFSGITNATVTNSVLIGRYLQGLNSYNNYALNNIIYATGYTDVGNNFDNEGSNLFVDPQLEDYDLSTSGNFAEQTFFNFDYRINSTSPGVNAGTDGQNIGLNQFFINEGWPSSPQILNFSILNPVVSQDGTLNIKVEAVSNQ